MLTLLLTVSLTLPVQAEENSAESEGDIDEFSFIDEGEKNREIREADRVPSSQHFLQDDDDDTFEPAWDTGKTPLDHGPSHEVDEEDPDLLDEQTPFNPSINFGDVYGDDDDYEIGISGGVVGGVVGPADYDDDLAGEEMVTVGLRPLGDNFPLTIVTREADAAVVELPVLVATRAQDFDGRDFWIIADILVNNQRVGESRHLVTGSSIAGSGPSFVWIKATAPLNTPDGTIGVKVSHAPPRGAETPLFTRSIGYQ